MVSSWPQQQTLGSKNPSGDRGLLPSLPFPRQGTVADSVAFWEASAASEPSPPSTDPPRVIGRRAEAAALAAATLTASSSQKDTRGEHIRSFVRRSVTFTFFLLMTVLYNCKK